MTSKLSQAILLSVIFAVSVGVIGILAINNQHPTALVMLSDDISNVGAEHPIFHTKAGVDQYLASNPHKTIGIVGYHVQHKDGTSTDVWSTNTRTNQGIICTFQVLFSGQSTAPVITNGSATTCSISQKGTTAAFNGYRFVDLVNGSGTMSLNGSDTIATSKIGGTRTSVKDGAITGNAANIGSPNNATVAGTSTYNQITITTSAYSISGTTGMTIRGALLTNSSSATAASVFAENAFTGVPLATSDTITITWTITFT